MCVSTFHGFFSQCGVFANFFRETNHTCVLEILLLNWGLLMMGFRSAELFLDAAEPISLAFPGYTDSWSQHWQHCVSKVCLIFGLG